MAVSNFKRALFLSARATLLFQFDGHLRHTCHRTFFVCVPCHYAQVLPGRRLCRPAYTNSADDFIAHFDRHSAGKRDGALYCEWWRWQGCPIPGLFTRSSLVRERRVRLALTKINRMRTGLVVANEYLWQPAAIDHSHT